MASSALILARNVLKLVSNYYCKNAFSSIDYPPRYTTSVFKRLTIFEVPHTSLCPLSTRSKSSELSTPSRPNQTSDRSNPENKDSGPKITLIGSDNNITLTSLLEAQKLSRRRDLKLVKMVDLDTKTQRPVYKLMTGAEYFEEDKKQRLLKASKKGNSIKGEKIVTLSHRISEHDVQARIKNILKWLTKNYEARIIINGVENSVSSTEKIYKQIENGIGENGRIVQKRQKGNDMRFQIIPPKNETKQLKENAAPKVENPEVA